MRALAWAILTLAATVVSAQIRLIDPDDFVDPRQHPAPLFISRLAAGVARSAADDGRPLRQDIGFLHLANSLYWSHFQLDYKHSELRGENVNGPAHVQVCPCEPPVFFPTSRDPLPGTWDTLQGGWYRSQRGDPAGPPVMLRTRLSISREQIDTIATYLDTGNVALRLHGHEQSIGLDADTYFRIAGHGVAGSLIIARTTRSGTPDDGSRSEIAYVSRPPARAIGNVLVRATLTVGGITGSGVRGLNVINPALEAFLHEWSTGANLHLIWSPLATRDGTKGWVTHHQILLSVDRAIFVKLLASH